MKIPPPFDGYSPKAISFLKDLKQNNNRDWFMENKPVYDVELKLKSHSLVIEMASAFASEDLPYLADIKKSLFRINRDIRFSKNKEPYKTNTGVFFPYKAHESGHKPVESAGLYLHIEPGECFIAAGMHMPMPEQLKGIRNKIDTDWQQLDEIMKSKKLLNDFPKVFESEKLKRIPRGFPEEHPAADLLKLKGFTVYADLPQKEIYKRDLIGILLNKAIVVIPFLEFLHQGTKG